MKRYVVVGGEAELALLLHIFPDGVEELDGAYAVYADEPPLGFDVVEAENVRGRLGGRAGARSTTASASAAAGSGRPGRSRRRDALAVVIDPGRAFGTGAHPTTRLTLELLQERRAGVASSTSAAAPACSRSRRRGSASRPSSRSTSTRRRRRGGGDGARTASSWTCGADALREELPPAELAAREHRARRRRAAAAAAPARRADRVRATSTATSRGPRTGTGWPADLRDGWAADLLERV